MQKTAKQNHDAEPPKCGRSCFFGEKYIAKVFLHAMTNNGRNSDAVNLDEKWIQKIQREWDALNTSIKKYGTEAIFPVVMELFHALAHEVIALRQIKNKVVQDTDHPIDALRKAFGHIRRAHLDFSKRKALDIQYNLKLGAQAEADYFHFTRRLLHCRAHEFKNIGSDDTDASLACFQKLLNDFIKKPLNCVKGKDDTYGEGGDGQAPTGDVLDRLRQLLYLVIVYNCLNTQRDQAFDREIIHLYLVGRLRERLPLLIHVIQLFTIIQIVALCPDGKLDAHLSGHKEWAGSVKRKIELASEYDPCQLPSVLYGAFLAYEQREGQSIQLEASAIHDVDVILQAALEFINLYCREGCPSKQSDPNERCGYNLAVSV